MQIYRMFFFLFFYFIKYFCGKESYYVRIIVIGLNLYYGVLIRNIWYLKVGKGLFESLLVIYLLDYFYMFQLDVVCVYMV